MSKKPLVSAMIIFLNEERFLQEAIDSVFSQTYESWELLLVDDGSTDASTEIALRCAGKYPGKVRYLEHEDHQNRGMSTSRNLGVRHAKGKYISYLDGDDAWLPGKLEQQVAILESKPEAVLVYGPLQRWYSWTGDPEDVQRDDLYGLHAPGGHINPDTLIKPPKLLALFLRSKQLIPAGVMVQREVIERVGGSEDVFRGSYEDAAVLVKVCLTSAVFVSSECWYKYRIHPNSFCRVEKKLRQSSSSRLFFLNWVEKYLSEQGVKDPEVWQALQGALWPYHHPTLDRLLEGYRFLIRQLEQLIIRLGRRTLSVSFRNWLWDRWLRYHKNLIN